MFFKNGSRRAGMQLSALGVIAAALVTGSFASAETIFTVNGKAVDSAVVDLYFQSRLGSATAQPTPEQRTVLMAELRDIYILSTQDAADELALDPQLAAQMELQRQSVIAQAVAGKFLETLTVSDEELQAEYEVQLQQTPPQEFKARHILVATQGEAVDVIRRLDEGGDFAELAMELSTGPTGPNGGDLDWFSPNQMVAPFATAVAAMEDGAYTSAPVQTQFGWHVILREDSRESTPPTFESVRESIDQRVKQKKFEAHLETLRAAAQE